VTVTTIAGSGTMGYIDDIGTNARFTTPGSIVVDVHGNIFVGEFGQSVIRKISPLGVVSTLAGKSGVTAFADGVGTNAKFNNPSGITIDASGTIFVADYHNCRIRKISQQGNVETLAGEGTAGYADGNGNVARFNYPVGVIVDSFGTVFVGDKDNHCIRSISSTTGDVSTFAGACGTSGLTDQTTKANARFSSPSGLSLDSSGNLFVVEYGSHRVRKISATSDEVTTFAGSATGSWGFQDDTGTNAKFYLPEGVSVDKVGNVYISDTHNNRIRKITKDRVVTTIAGHSNPTFLDGIGTNARFGYPH
jgi:sugar lactone lactonase YvrE